MTKVFKQRMVMGAYGASSLKPTILWSNREWIASLGDRKVSRTTCSDPSVVRALESTWLCASFVGVVGGVQKLGCGVPATDQFSRLACVVRKKKLQVTRYTDGTGRARCCGGPGLKGTQ